MITVACISIHGSIVGLVCFGPTVGVPDFVARDHTRPHRPLVVSAIRYVLCQSSELEGFGKNNMPADVYFFHNFAPSPLDQENFGSRHKIGNRREKISVGDGHANATLTRIKQCATFFVTRILLLEFFLA